MKTDRRDALNLARLHRAGDLRAVWVADGEQKVHVVLDSYGTHETAMIHQWLVRNPRFHLHFTPTSASWLTLVERCFAPMIEERIHRGTAQLEKAITDYLDSYNEDPNPFLWTKSSIHSNYSAK